MPPKAPKVGTSTRSRIQDSQSTRVEDDNRPNGFTVEQQAEICDIAERVTQDMLLAIHGDIVEQTTAITALRTRVDELEPPVAELNVSVTTDRKSVV